MLVSRPVLAAFVGMQMRAMEGTFNMPYIVSNCFQKARLCVGNLIFNSAIRFVNLNGEGGGGGEGCRFRLHQRYCHSRSDIRSRPSVLALSLFYNGELKQQRRRRQRKRHNSNRFRVRPFGMIRIRICDWRSLGSC